MKNSFYWHDYETFGANPSKDRPSQFAGLRTDHDLNVIDEPLIIYCQPTLDILPDPESCLVTGITPQQAMEQGCPEPEFIAQIHRQMMVPGTCVVGYNNIRFDDEVTRYTLYRNFYDPYQREWQNGNTRWDIIDMLRLTRALRPQGIEWPDHQTGAPSFKLEHLTQANGIAHDAAHDALSDVMATIAMAKLVKQKQPRLFDYLLRHRSKAALWKRVDLEQRKPFLHVSGMLSQDHMYTAMMMPLAIHSTNKNAVICFDLSADPESLITLDAEQIAPLVFTPQDQLPDGVHRIPLKQVHLNRAPVIVPPKLLDSATAKRLNIDLQRCERHWQRLHRVDLQRKLQAVFAQQSFDSALEPEQQLYDGFLPKCDKPLLERVQMANTEHFKRQEFDFTDNRYNKLLFNYRARYFPESLSSEEHATWLLSRRWRLTDPKSGYLTLEQQKEDINQRLSSVDITSEQYNVLKALQAWNQQMANRFNSDGSVSLADY